MTYCVGILLREGLIMISDTRTNAGIDNISTYRKMHVLADTDDRLILCMTAGNLSVTQHVLGQLAEGLPPHDPEEQPRRIEDMPSMFRCAQLVGEVADDARAGLARRKAGGGIPLAKGILLAAEGRFPGDYLIRSNLACYCSQLHQFEEARKWLEQAVAIDGRTVKKIATGDPDLQPLWDSLGGTLWQRE